MKIGIVGSGISGLSIANLLKKDNEVVIFEKQKEPGGLIKCERVNDCLFHKVGGHVFNSKNQRVSEWFWSMFDREQDFVKAKRKAKIFFRGKVIGYPIENNIYNLDSDTVKLILSELVDLEKLQKKSPFDFASFEAFLKGSFGETLYKLYFEPYNRKIWNIDLSTVSMEWLEGKLPMPRFSEIMEANILREEETTMVHSSFYYPKENGSQFIIDRLKQGLNILTMREIAGISVNEKQLIVADEAFDAIIYCGDIRRIPADIKKILTAKGVDVVYLESLRANGTSNLFCETDETDISWMYIPENFTRAHRIIYTGNFSESNNRGSYRKTCVVEFSGKVNYELMVEEIKKLPGNLRPLASNFEPDSYVVQDAKTRSVIKATKNILAEYNIYLLGRFAEWEYYNMDKAIEAAFTLKDKFSKLK